MTPNHRIHGRKFAAGLTAVALPAALLVGAPASLATVHDDSSTSSSSAQAGVGLRAGVESRAGIPKPSKTMTVISATRMKKNSLIKVTGVKVQATVTWKDGKKKRKKTKKKMTWNKTWKFYVSKKVKSVSIKGPGMAPMTVKVPKQGWNWWRTGSFTPIKNNAGKKSSFKFVLLTESKGRYRFDPCTYTTERNVDTSPLVVTSATKNRSTLTWKLPKKPVNAAVIRDSMKTINAHVGWNLKEVAHNKDADIVFRNLWSGNSDQYRYDVDADAGYDLSAPKKIRVFQSQIDLDFIKNAAGGTDKRLVMKAAMTALGLASVDDDQQIMFKRLLWGAPAYLGAGDREGLKRIGPSEACVFSVGDVYPEDANF